MLEGDFNEEGDDNWTKKQFEGYEVKEHEGQRPLLTGGFAGDLRNDLDLSFLYSLKYAHSILFFFSSLKFFKNFLLFIIRIFNFHRDC